MTDWGVNMGEGVKGMMGETMDRHLSVRRRMPISVARNNRLFRGTPFVVAASLLLAGCSSIPDAVNPAEWYKSTVELFSDDKGANQDPEASRTREQQVAEAAGATQSEKSYPKVSDVDKQQQSRNLGLAADPDRPRYAPAIPRQSQVAAATPPPAAPPEPSASAAQISAPTAPAPMSPELRAPKQSLTAGAPDNKLALTVPGVPQVSVPTRAEQEVEFAGHQNRMQKRLAEILSAAQKEPEFVRPTGIPSGFGVGETIVIGGGGVEGPEGPTLNTVSSEGQPVAGGGQEAWPLPAGAQRVATIVFPNGSARLTGKDRQILSQIVALQKERGGTLRIVGHSSSRTKNLSIDQHRAVNYKVSAQRARIVAKELQRLGANRGAVLTAALADSQPIYRENMPNGEAGNRRAEIYLVN